jgi:hypothetical protein
MAIYDGLKLIYEEASTDEWFNAWPSNDGQNALLTYITGSDKPSQIAGIYDIGKRMPIGKCEIIRVVRRMPFRPIIAW